MSTAIIFKVVIIITSIKKYRKRANKTQEQIASILGVTQGAIWQWETGKTHPRADMLLKIAALYGCTVDELLAPPEDEPETA